MDNLVENIRYPSVAESLKLALHSRINEVNTSIPAIVLAVKDQGELRVDVQPVIRSQDLDREVEEELPPILNVPVMMPYASKGGLSFPVSVGDGVLLIFSQRGIGTWKRGGDSGFYTPDTLNSHDMKDAIAITGLFNFNNSLNKPDMRGLTHSPNDLVLGFNRGQGSESEVRMMGDGTIHTKTPYKNLSEAGEEITLSVGSTKIEIKKSGVKIYAPKIEFIEV